jgi:hypothetical protein
MAGRIVAAQIKKFSLESFSETEESRYSPPMCTMGVEEEDAVKLIATIDAIEEIDLIGGVDVQTQHLGSNPHGREFRFLFILEDQAILVLMHFIMRIRLGT